MNREQKNKALYEISKVLSDIEKFANSDNDFPAIDYVEFISSIGGSGDVVDRLAYKARVADGYCKDLTINYVILLLSKMMVELSLESNS